MSITLTRASICTNYVRDPFAIETIDVDQLIREMSETSPDSDPAIWVGKTPMTEYDHVVLARDRLSGQCVGILGARDGVTDPGEAFLDIRTAFVVEPARGRGLMPKMIALMLLRAAGQGDVPRTIAARTSSTALVKILGSLATRMPGADLYPAAASAPISLATASLARRIARQIGGTLRFDIGTGVLRGGRVAAGIAPDPQQLPPRHSPHGEGFGRVLGPRDQVLAVLDLRAVNEESLIDAARLIYRRR